MTKWHRRALAADPSPHHSHHCSMAPIGSLSSAGEERTAQDKPCDDQRCFQEVNAFFRRLVWEHMAQVWFGDVMFCLIKIFLFSPRISLDAGRRPSTGSVAATFWPQKGVEVSKKADERQPRHTKHHKVLMSREPWPGIRCSPDRRQWVKDCCSLLPKPQENSRPSLFPWEYGELFQHLRGAGDRNLF